MKNLLIIATVLLTFSCGYKSEETEVLLADSLGVDTPKVDVIKNDSLPMVIDSLKK